MERSARMAVSSSSLASCFVLCQPQIGERDRIEIVVARAIKRNPSRRRATIHPPRFEPSLPRFCHPSAKRCKGAVLWTSEGLHEAHIYFQDPSNPSARRNSLLQSPLRRFLRFRMQSRRLAQATSRPVHACPRPFQRLFRKQRSVNAA